MEDRTSVILPDLFRCFLIQEPRVNDGYWTAKVASEQWLTESCDFTPGMRKKVNACDFSWFISIAAPDAPVDRLKTLCDWGNWVFPFDDLFDSGELRTDYVTSQHVLDSLMANMTGKHFIGSKLPIVKAHDDVYQRFQNGSSHGIQRRFARAMQHYTSGVAHHVEHFTTNHIPSLQEMLSTRQLSVGVAPLYHLVEYAHEISLPDEVFEHPVIQTLERLGADFVILSNDILSYRKEEGEGCPFNMTAACRLAGQSAQEAFNTLGALLERRYIQWNQSIHCLPSWGVEIDSEVRRYIVGIQNVVQANISWSFRSERYLGKNASEVRRTRKIDVMTNPPYLKTMDPDSS
ncbi:terpene synthase metal binding domain-containing protein [Periconia macrospinosa]|uniref:Terpene synthase n=1 Tax=Periconia macrospinosa TaxID=97972 RepID=A0A2V1DWK2_9PLEO|nr:terpene synthase metal binding domain-containing protein [Periconia macrospinosa]